MSQDRPEQPQARLFIAILVPEQVKARIFAAQEQLRRAAAEGVVRWADQHQFHLTLRFLGNVLNDQIPALTEAARQACSQYSRMPMTAQGVGFFPNARRPRVIWAGITETAGKLHELQQTLQRATVAFTTEPPQNEFTGHITLGRFKTFERSSSRDLVDAAERLTQVEFGNWECSEVHLVQSRLSPHGATHTSITEFDLQP